MHRRQHPLPRNVLVHVKPSLPTTHSRCDRGCDRGCQQPKLLRIRTVLDVGSAQDFTPCTACVTRDKKINSPLPVAFYSHSKSCASGSVLFTGEKSNHLCAKWLSLVHWVCPGHALPLPGVSTHGYHCYAITSLLERSVSLCESFPSAMAIPSG